jgi:hypothetical protein
MIGGGSIRAHKKWITGLAADAFIERWPHGDVRTHGDEF